MKFFYLIGKNIKNSLSPKIHNHTFKKLGIDANYKLMEISDLRQFSNLFQDFKSQKICGINITNPYKINVYPYMNKAAPSCNQIKAVNCINFKNGQIIGHNTDWFGFLKMLKSNNINLIDKKIKIIGLGGSHNAIIYALGFMGCTEIELYDRQNVDKIVEDNSNKDFVVINCSPKHFINDEKKFIDYFISRKNIWIDLLYTKLSTQNQNLINRNHKNLYINGLDMLIYQALASISIWLSEDIFKNVDLYTLKSTLKKELNVN
tara:strand:- start:31 stop:816 length:786 start_codon:yes stop_codon:yes gene_type:complete